MRLFAALSYYYNSTTIVEAAEAVAIVYLYDLRY